MTRHRLPASAGVALLVCVALLLCVDGCQCGTQKQKQEPPLRVATGGDEQTASEIVAALKTAGTPAALVETRSAIASVEALAAGKVDLALVPVDVAWYGLNGTGVFSEKAAGFSAVMTMRYEAVGFVVRADSQIRSVQDLRGQRVVVGPPGSTLEMAAGHLLGACGLSFSDLGQVIAGTPAEGSDAVREGRADAWLEPSVLSLLQMGGYRPALLPMSCLEQLVKDHPFYSHSSLLADSEDPEPPGYALIETVVFARDGLPASDVEHIAEALAAQRPLVDASGSLPKRMSIPLHPGAKAYLEARSQERRGPSPRTE